MTAPNTVALTRLSHATAEGPLTLAGIPGYTVQTRLERVDGGLADKLHVAIKHDTRTVGTGTLRVATPDSQIETEWWGYMRVYGFPWSVSGVRGRGVLEFREDVRLPAKAGWGE